MAGLTKLEVAKLVSVPRLLAILGDASYSIYLTHVSLLGLCLKVLIKVGVLSALGGPALFLCAFVMATIGGVAAYYLVERPLLSLFRRRQVAKQSDSGSVAAT
jgi:exopolysaccharide production protein ExoZ